MKQWTLLKKCIVMGIIFGVVLFSELGVILTNTASLNLSMNQFAKLEVPILNKAHEVKLAVVQVQQWLTDISATRGLDGLNDGFTEAENNASRVKTMLLELQQLDPANALHYQEIVPLFEAYYAAGRRMAQAYVESGPAGGNPLMADFDAAAAKLTTQVNQLVQRVQQRVANTSNEEVSAINELRMIVLVGSVILLGVLVAMALVVRSILHSLGGEPTQMADISQRVANGDLTVKFTDTGKETGIYAAMKEMVRKLHERSKAEHLAAAENARLKQALDKVSSSVMVADSDHNIIYINQSTETMFRNGQKDIQSELPGFNVERLVGSNIDLFHKNPSYQQQILKQMSGTHRAQFEIGGRTMHFIANPVVGSDGVRLGTVVEWQDRTNEVAVEHEIAEIVSAAQAGDLEKRVSLQGKEGFFLVLAQGINHFVEVVAQTFSDIGQVMGALSQGDLSHNITKDYEGLFGRVKEDVNTTIERLQDIVGQIRESTDMIASASTEIVNGNNNLSQRTEQQASSLEETASSMEQLTSTVKNNADNAQQANQMAGDTRKLAEKGGAVVQDAITAMQAINESSTKIAEIIGVIDEIAFQTNLLALNASVEAARAGEQGRGFAVVATEVRNLAQRSATAAKEIKELISDSVGKVQNGSNLVSESGVTLEEIVGAVKKVGSIIAEIATASAEQSAGIDQVNRAVMQMDEMTQQNAALAEQTSSTSVSMRQQADEMAKQINFFLIDRKAIK